MTAWIAGSSITKPSAGSTRYPPAGLRRTSSHGWARTPVSRTATTGRGQAGPHGGPGLPVAVDIGAGAAGPGQRVALAERGARDRAAHGGARPGGARPGGAALDVVA